MSGNIVIRQGLDQPWELNGTDMSKSDDINLLNLAVGQLAQLGSEFGEQISIQANVTAEIGEAVNVVQDRSAEVASKFDTWSQPVDFGIAAAPTISSILNKQYDPTDSNNVVVKLQSAMNVLNTAEVFYPATKFVTATFTARNPNGPVSFVSSSFYPDQSANIDFTVTPPKSTPIPVDDLIIYHKRLPSGAIDTALSVNLDGTTYTLNDTAIKPLWVPSTTTGITNLQLSAQASTAAANTALLLDKTQVLPTPSDTVDPATLPADAKVTLDVVLGDATGIRFKVSDQPPQYYYPPVELDQLKTITDSKGLVASDENTIVKLSTGGYGWVYDTNFSGLTYRTISPESFVAAPTSLQKASWLSQYSDKIVRITQRSAEQTNFLKMLTDRYTYFYEAATNVLQVLSSLERQQARN
jgi:hypothetical protein